MVPIAALWHALITGLSVIWPSRLSLAGVSLGDVWPCASLKKETIEEGDELVPFHKLTGWTTYSLLEPMEKILGWKFDGIDDLTGLPEYRNGERDVTSRGSDLLPEALMPFSCFHARWSVGRPRRAVNQAVLHPSIFLSKRRFSDPKASPFASCNRRMEGDDRHRTVRIHPIHFPALFPPLERHTS